ncbi:tetratricopeptide repeat protein [Rhodanobacter sp. MP1X3]|uniref:tetratricopeptide repeat protein n=1 Tax=Rhodanobacter sp. MP1X3 TaxID=2723086 RepID=UPI00160D7EA9|nr:tetratricopeptide repeat protein [Rhodanobacter sp. MP1X3]MBB6241616.1 tetratricopeptide (TPR) repeat protein [Rhodanobacter sp. MP1X3]
MSGRRDQHEADPHRRTEPTLGDIDHLDSPRAPSSDGLPQVNVEARNGRPGMPSQPTRKKPAGSKRGWLLPVLLLVLIAVIATAWLNQGWLRGKLPNTELNDVLSRAQQALQAGHLDGQDGTSARELFQAAVALQPDNDRAADGLRQVGQAELAQADASLQAGHLDQAAQQAASARDLLGGGTDVDRLDAQITQARAAQGSSQVKTVDLVDQAQQALADGKLEGPHGAGALYKQMLQADPNNAVAAHGLDQVGDALAVQAHKAFDANDSTSANATVEELAALQPNNGALPALRAQQAQTRKQDDGALDAELKQGMDAFRAGRIVGQGDDTALSHFKAALAIDPDNADARAGLGKVAQALTVQASAAIDAGDTGQATQLLDQAAALAPKSADLAAARARLNSTSAQGAASPAGDPNSQADDSVQPSAPVVLSPQQSATVARLVQRAQVAAARGDIMLPPGNSAYDLYRNALVIDGSNAVALQGLQALPVQVEKQFNQALSNGNLGQASDMLENLAELAPGEASQSALSDRLAGAWLDQAEQQLSSGDRIGASQSLDRARKLSPNQPRVLDLAARLQSSP